MNVKETAKSAFLNNAGHFRGFEHLITKLSGWTRLSRWHLEHVSSVSRFGNPAKPSYDDRLLLWQSVISSQDLNVCPLDYLEFGVYGGNSFRWWAEHIGRPDARFVGFDTFTGLPRSGWNDCPVGTFDVEGRAPEINDSRCTFEVGLFQDTLPRFLSRFVRNGQRVIVNMDADIYSSTLFVLASIASVLRPRDVLLFDEFLDPLHEFRAFEDFCEGYGLKYEVLGTTVDLNRVCLMVK